MQTDFSRGFFYPCINHDINRVINHMTNHTHRAKWVLSCHSCYIIIVIAPADS